MILRQLETLAFSYNEFVWWVGKIINIMDPNKAGRAKVKIYGYHDEVEDNGLPWALCVHPIISAALGGYGYSPTNILVGSTVIGFFADGHDALTPIIFATVGSEPVEGGRYGGGESDVNRLSRGIADDNMIPKKLGNLDVGVPEAFGGTWSEPVTPFATTYPDGYVFEAKCGHIQEFDSTGGSERINTFHKDGSFEEYHPAGDKVDKIVKDKYTITVGDDFCHIMGECNMTVDGPCKILVRNDAFIEVDGDLNQRIRGDYNLKVHGAMNTEILGNRTTTVLGGEIYQVGGKLRIESNGRSDMTRGNYYIDVCGNFDVSGTNNFINKPWVVKGGAPMCDHTELPPLFTNIR